MKGMIVLPWMVLALTCATGTGALADEPGRPVHKYLDVRLSPNGEKVAAVEGDAPPNGFYPPVRELVIYDVRGGSPTRIDLPCGRVRECWPASPTWSADSKMLSFTLRTPGTHARSVYSVSAQGAGLSKLLEFDGTIEDLRYGPDGRLAMLAVHDATKEVGATEAGAAAPTDGEGAPHEQRIAMLENGSLRWVSPPDLFVYEYDWLPAKNGFIGTASPGDGDSHWWTAKLYAFAETGRTARVIYTPTTARQQLAAPTASPDGSTVAFIGGIMSDFGATGGDVYLVGLDGREATNLTPQVPVSATALNWRCNGHLQAQLLAGDRTDIVDFGAAPRPGKSKMLVSTQETLNFGVSAGFSTSCKSAAVALTHESFTVAPEIEVGNFGHLRNLTAANAGLRFPSIVRSISWKSDGLDVQGWLLLPEHPAGKMPMITVVHGGPASAAVPFFGGPGLTRDLLDRNYAVFRPNPRGSFGQGERFTAANVRDFGHGDLRDILRGIDAAASNADIDTARLGIMGGSYGGFMTMWAVTQTDRFKAAVAIAGVSNWQSYYGENGIDAWMIPYFGASVYQDPEVYARSSPINFIRNVKTPTFEYVGERDIECPAPQTQEFWHALKALDVPTSIMIYPGEGHGLRDPQHIADALERTLGWFERYLR